jgi:hypothetical protein
MAGADAGGEGAEFEEIREQVSGWLVSHLPPLTTI